MDIFGSPTLHDRHWKVESCISEVLFLIWNNYLQVEKKTGPAAVALADVAAAAKFVEDNEIAVLGFFADAEGNFLNFPAIYTAIYEDKKLVKIFCVKPLSLLRTTKLPFLDSLPMLKVKYYFFE